MSSGFSTLSSSTVGEAALHNGPQDCPSFQCCSADAAKNKTPDLALRGVESPLG